MKKLSILLFVTVLALTLSACGYGTKGKNPARERVISSDGNGVSGYNSVSDGTNSPNNQQTVNITRQEALEIALNEVGATQNDIRDLEIDFDYERGVKIWEIDFDYGSLEYSYDINADSGVVVRAERERDY